MSLTPELLPDASRDLVLLLRATLAGRPPAIAVTDALLAQAAWHGVEAFLYPAVAAIPAGTRPPDAALARWRCQCLAAAAAAVRREAQTRELLAALQAARVRAVPLKGTWLAARVYPEPGQRPMDDIDILVPPRELPAAQAALHRLGYAPRGNAASPATDCDQAYTRASGDWPVELHWHLGVARAPLHRPELPGLWERLVPESLLGVTVCALRPEEHFVYLAYHVLHHRFALPLRSYLDLALLGRALERGADAAFLQAVAGEWGLATALPRVAAIVGDLFDLPLPALPGPAREEEPARLAEAARTILASTAQRTLPAERTWLDLRRRGPLSRLALLLQRVFLPRAFLRREYACARWRAGLPLAYLLRARDLLRRNAGTASRALRRDPALAHRLDEAAAREALLHWALGAAARDTR